MPVEVLSPVQERHEMSPAYTAIRRSVRSDGFKRLEAQRVLPPVLVQCPPSFLHADHIGTPRLVIRDGDGWVVIGYHAGVLHRITDPDSAVPTGTVFYQPRHRIAYRLGVIDDPIELPEGRLLYSNDGEWMALVSYGTGQVVPVISMKVPVGSSEWTEDDDTNRVQRQIPFAVFSIPDRPTLGDVLGALSSFRELVPLVRGASLYRYSNGFIVRTSLATSYVEYPIDILQPEPVADAIDEIENTPGIVEIPVTGDLDIGRIGSGDWVLYPSCERWHELYVSDVGMCLSPIRPGDIQYQPNTYLYRSDVYTLGNTAVNMQGLLHLLWRYVGTGAGALVALIDHRHSSYYRTSTHSWMLCPVYVAAVTRSEHGTRLIAPVPRPSTDLVHLWMAHQHRD
jgi:hypothetical protein